MINSQTLENITRLDKEVVTGVSHNINMDAERKTTPSWPIHKSLIIFTQTKSFDFSK